MLSMDHHKALGGAELLHQDPVVFELDRLHNLLIEKQRELGAAENEIKALRVTETIKDKAIEELTNNSNRLDEKLRFSQNHLEQKNLEIKKLANEKREAQAAQYAAERTLRMVHANQKYDDSVPVEYIIAPLEADIKIYKSEIAALQEDNKALERLTKSKELALLEAEKILRSALERALIVEEIQNHNFELKRQIEICQEENRILDKTNRQKVLEVEKLTRTIKDLEEAILAGGAAANTLRDYQRQISELNEDKRTLERELARFKVLANRVATVVANEWKDDNDKVMPVKQWLEERRLLQAETRRLREKLAISERTVKAEAQLKDKLKLRLKTLEEGLKHVSNFSHNPNAFCASPKPAKSGNIFGFLSSNTGLKRSASQPRSSSISKTSPLQQPNGYKETLEKKDGPKENIHKKSLWVARSKADDCAEKENHKVNDNTTETLDNADSEESETADEGNQDSQNKGSETDDMVSGFLYDKLQKEVIILRKSCEVKESNLSSKDEEIKILTKKLDTLTKAIEVESKRLKREVATKEKEETFAKMDDDRKNRNANSKRFVKAS